MEQKSRNRRKAKKGKNRSKKGMKKIKKKDMLM